MLVYVDLDGVLHLTGRLGLDCARHGERHVRVQTDRFRHSGPVCRRASAHAGPWGLSHRTRRAALGAIGSSGTDRWGRALMRRMSRREAEREGRAVRTLREIDFLLMVDDEARQGALRFAEQPGGPFLREPDASRIRRCLNFPNSSPRLSASSTKKTRTKTCDCCLRLALR